MVALSTFPMCLCLSPGLFLFQNNMGKSLAALLTACLLVFVLQDRWIRSLLNTTMYYKNTLTCTLNLWISCRLRLFSSTHTERKKINFSFPLSQAIPCVPQPS